MGRHGLLAFTGIARSGMGLGAAAPTLIAIAMRSNQARPYCFRWFFWRFLVHQRTKVALYAVSRFCCTFTTRVKMLAGAGVVNRTFGEPMALEVAAIFEAVAVQLAARGSM